MGISLKPADKTKEEQAMNTAERAQRLLEIDQVIARGKFHDDWESLSQYQVPEWYQNAKFGIFIHWGVYSVPAYRNEWYPRNMYIQGTPEFEHHVKTYGPHDQFGYKDFIPLFKAEKFSPEDWASLFKEAGARYVIPVGEHHDGFQMYKSEISHWNAAEMGPCRDTTGELKAALDKQGLTMGISSHRIEHWFFLGHGKDFPSDIHDPIPRDDLYWPSMPEPKDHFSRDAECPPSQEFMEDWLLRCCEMVDRFHPAVFYFDWWILQNVMKPYIKKFAAYYYNKSMEWGVKPAINYKQDTYMFGTAVPDMERGHFANVQPYFWQTDTAIAKNSWCYTEQNEFKRPVDLVRTLIDVVSKNGTLLLNVGPKADGTIGPEDTQVLKAIGEWLKKNGEAIYDTRPWRVFGEGPTNIEEGQFAESKEKVYAKEDIRFTVKGGNLYVLSMQWPEDGKITVRSLSLPQFIGGVARVEALGFEGKVEWSRDENGLHISAPFIQSQMPVAFRLVMA